MVAIRYESIEADNSKAKIHNNPIDSTVANPMKILPNQFVRIVSVLEKNLPRLRSIDYFHHLFKNPCFWPL